MNVDKNMPVRCIRVSRSSDPLLNQVEKNYNESFPEQERRNFSLVRRLLEETPNFTLYLLLRESHYVGFISVWSFDFFSYIEHFAIDQSMRNGGIGTLAMKQLLSLVKSPVVLEVERPTDAFSRRRIGFYERLGFALDAHAYRQPPYRENGEWLDMHLMTYGEWDRRDPYDTIRAVLYQHVYGLKITEVNEFTDAGE